MFNILFLILIEIFCECGIIANFCQSSGTILSIEAILNIVVIHFSLFLCVL